MELAFQRAVQKLKEDEWLWQRRVISEWRMRWKTNRWVQRLVFCGWPRGWKYSVFLLITKYLL